MISLTPCDSIINVIKIFQPSNNAEWAALGLSCSTIFLSNKVALVAIPSYLGYKWVSAKTLPDPNEVQTIYTPPHANQKDISNLLLYEAKINNLKKDPNLSLTHILFLLNKHHKSIVCNCIVLSKMLSIRDFLHVFPQENP